MTRAENRFIVESVRFINALTGLAVAVLLILKSASILTADLPGSDKLSKPAWLGGTWRVTNALELQLALLTARPGQTIELSDGVFRGGFTVPVSGTADKPITLRGSKNTVLDGGSILSGYGLLVRADYWRIESLTVRNAKKGIVLDQASHNILSRLRVYDIGEEAVRMRAFSSDNILRDSLITRTGRLRPGFGEGVYIGTSHDKWEGASGLEPDRSDRNQVIDCVIGPDVTAEHIDIKEGTSGGAVVGNMMDATGISGQNFADSWMDIKGNDYVIAKNEGVNRGPSAIVDAVQTHIKLDEWGMNNVFSGNVFELNAQGFGFNIQTSDFVADGNNRIGDDNVVFGAKKGPSNIVMSPEPDAASMSR